MERRLTPHGRLLHHERPFTREGNYLVDLLSLGIVIFVDVVVFGFTYKAARKTVEKYISN